MIVPIPSAIVRVASVVVNLICSFIVPCVENIAYKVRIGEACDCPSPPSSPHHHVHRGRQHKKLKGQNVQNNDIKRIKLLLDITVGQNGSKVLDIQASARGQDKITEELQCKKNPGIILRLLNLPSSIMLYFVYKLRQIAHDLDEVNNPCKTCNDDRIKKSPKRRITRSNYRKIIPFFPFNLLGFSNYSAFQMPSITNSCTSTADDYNNLNASNVSTGNGKTRCKRRRNSSSEESSALSDEDISYLEYPEKSNKGSSYYSANGGVDEVDSDETAETVTKRMTSSSSSNEPNHHQVSTRSSNVNGKRIQVALNTSTSEDNAGNMTAFTDLDNSDVGGVGEEQHVRFSFIQELNEAANESYNSLEDPDYEPSQSCSSTTDSFATDKGNSDENSFVENVAASTTNEDEAKSVSVPTTVEPSKAEEPKSNGASTPAPANPESVPSNGTPKTEEVTTNGSSSKLESVPSNGSPQTEGEATPTNGTPKAEATPTNGAAKKDNFPSKFNNGKGKSKKGNNAYGYQQK